MNACPELLKIIEPAYAPCAHFTGACRTLRWDPGRGHIPRGFLGATGRLEDVKLVLVFAEPGDPPVEQCETMLTAWDYTYQCMRNGKDLCNRSPGF